MLLQNLRARIGARLKGDSEAGFTLIELLVVMLILGILAAIAIPAFFNQKDKATDASAKSMVRSAETAMETYATEHGGAYLPTPSAEALHKIEPTIQVAESEGEGLQEPESTESTYTVTVESSLGHSFSIGRAEDGTTTLTCTPPGQGGCAEGTGDEGVWGK